MTDTRAASKASSPVADQLEPGRLSVLDIVFFVVAAAAPLTVMAGVAPFAIQFNGIGAPGGYVFAGIVLTLFAVGFSAMARYVKNAGAFYAYIAQGLGRPMGVGAALLAVFSYNAIGIGLIGAIATFASATIEDLFGVSSRWEIWAFVSIAIIGWLGYRRITLSARVLGVALALEVAILLVLAVPVLLQGGAAGLVPGSFAPQNVFADGAGAVLVLSFAAFIGFEATAIYSEEARDPRRTVPRATYIAVGFLALFYTFITWMIIVAFGPERILSVAQNDPEGMFFTATTDYVGRWATVVMRVLIVTSAFAAALALHNCAARYFYALGRERVLPAALGRTHPVTHSPWIGSLTQTALAVMVVAGFALAGADPYLQLFFWTNGPGILGFMALWVMCSLAVIGFFWGEPRGTGAWQRLVAPALAFVGLLFAGVLMVVKFDLFTGAGGTVNAVLISSAVLAFVAGVVRAFQLRRGDPAAYERLTTTSVEGDTDR